MNAGYHKDLEKSGALVFRGERSFGPPCSEGHAPGKVMGLLPGLGVDYKRGKGRVMKEISGHPKTVASKGFLGGLFSGALGVGVGGSLRGGAKMKILKQSNAMRVIFFYPGEEGTYIDNAFVTLFENGIVHIKSHHEETTTHLQNCEILWQFEVEGDDRASKVRLLKPKNTSPDRGPELR